MTPTQYLELGDLLPDPLFLLSGNGRIQAANCAALRALDLAADQVFGRSLAEFSENDKAQLVDYLRLCSGSKQALAGQLLLKTRDNKAKVFRCDGAVLTPAAAGSDALICLRCIPRQTSNSQFILLNRKIEELNREIVAHRRAEEQVRALNEELEQRIDERTTELREACHNLESFAYSVSHDLRAPLRSISGFSQALLEDYSAQVDETGRDFLQRIRSGAMRMEHLIDDILEFSRAGRRAIRREQVSLTELCADIIDQLNDQEPGRKAEITVAENINTVGDAHLLRVVLDNLLRNAWKYSGKLECARIGFGELKQGREQVFFVKDNGAGFDMRYADKLFDVFQRLHADGEFAGTGIGLAMVKRIVERHGGRIWAESGVGEGATFYFTLGKAE